MYLCTWWLPQILTKAVENERLNHYMGAFDQDLQSLDSNTCLIRRVEAFLLCSLIAPTAPGIIAARAPGIIALQAPGSRIARDMEEIRLHGYSVGL